MKKRSRKLISILLTLALLATLLVPMATPALAAGTISALTVPTVADTTGQSLGAVKVVVPAGTIASGDSVIFKIPDGWDFGDNNADNIGDFNTTAQTAVGAADNRVYVPNFTDPGLADANGLVAGNIAITALDTNDEIQLTATANQSVNNEFIFYIYLRDVDVEADTSDDCVVKFDGRSGTGFPMGEVTVAKVASSGNLTVTASGADTGNNNFNFDLRVKEDVLGSLDIDAESLTLVLPDGYEWTTSVAANEVSGVGGAVARNLWGESIIYTLDRNADADELSINFKGVDADNGGDVDAAEIATATARETNEASAWEFVGMTFTVADENKVDAGDIEVKVKGESNCDIATLKVGTYGDYNAGISAKSTPTVYAGKVEQEVGDIVIKEEIAQSLVDGRYITLTLPSFSRWTTVPRTASNEAVTLTFAGVSGSDGNVLKYTIRNTGGGDPAEVELEDIEVLLDVAAPGDLKVTLGGTSGLTGEVAIAKVSGAITAKAEGKPEVKIGMASQKIADVTITEVEAGAIEEGTLTLKVPAGCEFTKLPKVEVVSGDIGVDFAQVARSKRTPTGAQPTDYYQYLNIPIDNDSNEVSAIKISDIYVSVDRTVSEGDLKVAVLGNAVIESNGLPLVGWYDGALVGDIDSDGTADYDATASLFPATAALTSVAAGVISTPAPGETKADASFVIGDTTFKLNGVEMTLDAAPYIKDGRTYMPLRYVAQALGVADSNILWDGATKKVTLIKGNTFVQLTIGSNILMVNGMPITMDVAPEITSDRTCLPIRFVAQVFGATVGWDEATQTVTIK